MNKDNKESTTQNMHYKTSVTKKSSALVLLTTTLILSGCQSTTSLRPQTDLPQPPYQQPKTQSHKSMPFPQSASQPRKMPTNQITEAQKAQIIADFQRQKQQERQNTRMAQAIKQKKSERRTQMQAQLIQQSSSLNSKNVNNQKNSDIPAFKRLLKQGVGLLRNNKLVAAKDKLLLAQRLAPSSPLVYLYLGEVALAQKQATKAEMLSRRGLSVSNSPRITKSLWQVIYLSAKLRNNAGLMQKAQSEIAKVN